MQIVKNILTIAKRFHISDQQLCKIIGSRSISKISDWKRGKSRPYANEVAAIATYLGCSADVLLGIGVFQNWNEILENRDSVWNELQDKIPADLRTPNGRNFLIAYLYTKMFSNFDEIALAKWFGECVLSVNFTTNTPNEEIDGYNPAVFEQAPFLKTEITFTSKFNEEINALRLRKNSEKRRERFSEYQRLCQLKDGVNVEFISANGTKEILRMTQQEVDDPSRKYTNDAIDDFLVMLPKIWDRQDNEESDDSKSISKYVSYIAARDGKGTAVTMTEKQADELLRQLEKAPKKKDF